MRRYPSLVQWLCVALIALMLSGCNADMTNVLGNDDVTRLVVALPQTRIAIGDKDDATYPVYWSEGDRIVVNGVRSEEVEIDSENRSKATFEVKSMLSYPLAITYPYCSSTTAAAPVVEFRSEQTYTKGSFAEGSVPMCGYVANKGESVAMKYLAGVLKFTIKASDENVALQKVVVTSLSGEKLSGEFAVNCSSATISATERTQNTITYLLPSDYKLSTTAESEFYIAVPATEVGSCLVEFVEQSGERMECKWNPTSAIKGGNVREFRTITYKRNANITLDDVSLPPFDEVVQTRIFRLRAMSYNVHNCSGTDGVLDYERVAAAIAEQNADAVGLQELDSMTTRRPLDVLGRLAELTGMHPTFGAAIDRQGGKYGVGVLTKEKPLSYYRVPLPCSSEPRVMLVVEMENYYFCCTHFSLLAEYRTEAAKIIIEEAKKLDKPMFLVGDLNATRDQESMQLLAQHFNIFNKRPPIYTFPANAPRSEIDYICLYSGRGALAAVFDYWVPEVPVVSDHRPTVMDVMVSE